MRRWYKLLYFPLVQDHGRSVAIIQLPDCFLSPYSVNSQSPGFCFREQQAIFMILFGFIYRASLWHSKLFGNFQYNDCINHCTAPRCQFNASAPPFRLTPGRFMFGVDGSAPLSALHPICIATCLEPSGRRHPERTGILMSARYPISASGFWLASRAITTGTQSLQWMIY